MDDRGFVVDHFGLLNVAIIQGREGLLGAKSLSGPDSRNNLFSEIAAISYVFQRLSDDEM